MDNQSGQQADYGGYSQQHAEDIFRSVQGDVDVIKEAFGLLPSSSTRQIVTLSVEQKNRVDERRRTM
eukprot:gene13483-9648_t